jgi:metal-responsive CopG/Arc/MetJ family transcriptional regulator
MARFTLSIADDVAAQLDALAAEHNLNRSQTAEQIFRSYFQNLTDPGSEDEENGAGDAAASDEQTVEMRDYLTLLYTRHEALRAYVMMTTDYTESAFAVPFPPSLPAPPWVQREE